MLKEWQQNSDLRVGSDKVTADNNLTNQRQNVSQNVSESFDSDLKKLKVLRVEKYSNPVVAFLNINSLGEKINHLHKICKESPTDILCWRNKTRLQLPWCSVWNQSLPISTF